MAVGMGLQHVSWHATCRIAQFVVGHHCYCCWWFTSNHDSIDYARKRPNEQNCRWHCCCWCRRRHPEHSVIVADVRSRQKFNCFWYNFYSSMHTQHTLNKKITSANVRIDNLSTECVNLAPAVCTCAYNCRTNQKRNKMKEKKYMQENCHHNHYNEAKTGAMQGGSSAILMAG